jgi:geranylgeranylglycerol-phosphate geranylgeranyltransferase
MARREYAKNWWDLSRGGNVVWGIITLGLGALMLGVDYGQSVGTLTLHAFCIGAFIAGWFAINDLLDIEVDRVNHPRRPLPSDNISETGARKYGHRMMILSGVGLVAIILNDEKNIGGMAWIDSVVVWLFALLMMIAYELDGKPFNPCLKKRMFWGNLTIAGTVAVTILFGAAAIGHATDPLLWLIAISAMIMTTAREICMDISDQGGDFDRNSLPKVVGLEKARRTVWFLSIASSLTLILPFALGFLPWDLAIFVLPAIGCAISIKTFLGHENDAKAADMLRFSMISGLLGLAACGVILNS